jgi:hypothetical protein
VSKIILGLTSYATAGKDTFLSLLSQRLPNVQRFALADQLKQDVRDFCIGNYNIDPLNCSAAEKETLRPIFVAHGKIKRTVSKGTYWHQILESKIKASNCDIAVITDIRYAEYKDTDEVFWLKRMGGLLVHIKRYTIENSKRVYIEAPNEEERRQNPILHALSDYKIDWFTEKNIQDNIPHIDKFVEFLKEKNLLG